MNSMINISPRRQTRDLEEQKPHSQRTAPPVRSIASRFPPVLAVLLLAVYALIEFLRWDGISTSEITLSALILVAILLYFVSKNKSSLTNFSKQACDEQGSRLGFYSFASKTNSKPVHWFIGESNREKTERKQGNDGQTSCSRQGVELYSNGDFYEGEFDEGRCSGSGVYNYRGKGRYEGDWANGKYNGYGVESWARGSRYRGQYRQGMRHGFGVYMFYTGDAYSGRWCNGQSHGIGVQTCADGSCYFGQFKLGVKHGLGCYHFRNGDTYGGEYFGDRIHGFGVYQFVNGHCYEGSWHEGRGQGYGMYTFRNSMVKCGEWDSGNLRTPLPPLNDAVLRVVEAARKAAEKAIQLQRVDEEVNEAVAAANRAAAMARVAAVKAVESRIIRRY